MKRILLVYSDLVWADPVIVDHCRSLQREGFLLQILVIAKKQGEDFEKLLRSAGFEVHFMPLASKWGLPLAILKTFFLLRKIKPDLVHTNLVFANLVGLISAKLAGIKIRIYTRHHSDWYHSIGSRAVILDKIANFFATKIVAISENVKDTLVRLESVPLEKITLIHHGFKPERFDSVTQEQVQRMKEKYGITGKSPVIGIFSRYVPWKGVQFILPALLAVVKKYPNSLFLFANAFESTYREFLDPHFKKLPASSLKEIESESDVHVLYKCLDFFVHVPVNPKCEAYGMVYVEALMAGVPSVFTPSGIAAEFAVDRENSMVVPFQDEEAIEAALLELIEDSKLQERLKSKGRELSVRLYSYSRTLQKTKDLYLEA